MDNKVDVMTSPQDVFRSTTIEVLTELITRTGCTVCFPAPGGQASRLEEALHFLDEVFQPRGVRVRMALRWNRFGTLVNEARKRYGMPPHSSFDDMLILEPDDAPPALGRVK